MNEPLSKDLLYGDFRDSMAKKEKLALRAAHKALDIPDDDMNINAQRTQTNHGISTMGAIGIAIAAGLPTVLLAALMYFRGGVPTPATPAPTPAIQDAAPKKVEWDVELKWNGKEWTKKVTPVQ